MCMDDVKRLTRFPFGQIFLNDSFAPGSTWIYPEESGWFHGYEKPHVVANRVAVAVARPAAASGPLPTVVPALRPIAGQSPDTGDGLRFLPLFL